MAGLREIQNRIKSIQDTRKITNAMYMISSTKMRKAKQDLENTEPYFYTLQSMMARLLRHLPDVSHMYFEKEEKEELDHQKKVGLLVITGDKGLAGAYNHNVEKAEEEIMKMPGHHKLFVVGELGRHYFVSQGHEIEQNFQYTVQKPNLSRARIISETLMEQFNNGELDEVYVVYTRMENSMVSEVETVKLLPLERSAFGEDSIPANLRREAIQLYPSVESVMDNIVPNYVTGMIYGCLVEAYASEHNARMTAMKSATDSAETIIKDLSIAYNRARQAAITQEITEVCAGAKAQKRKRK